MLKKHKFIHSGMKQGKFDDTGHNDGRYYHYGVDINGNYWISQIPFILNSGRLDHDAPKKWKPNGTDGDIVMALTKEEIRKKFDGYTLLSDRCHNNASEYVTKHTGGSIRHAGIRVIDVMEMIHDYRNDAQRAIEDAYALGRLHEANKRKVKK